MHARIDRDGLESLVGALVGRGFEVIAPTIRSGAIVYDVIEGIDELPRGLTTEQGPGVFRVVPRDDDALFGFTVGPTPWRRFLHPPRELLCSTRLDADGLHIESPPMDASPRAFLGIRSCDIAAMGVYDRVMLEGDHSNERYASRREHVLVVAVQCGVSAPTCFCPSMGTGPRASTGFDLALTELPGHIFVVEVGTAAGQELLDTIPHSTADSDEVNQSHALSGDVEASITRRMRSDAPEILRDHDHSRWTDVAQRCLSCGNCTMVCPTCFCTATEDIPSLDASTSERFERWDSCFTLDYSQMGGESVRTSTLSRYRNWLTHKLSTWHDQFGTSGCVGCGRCIVWCPVGIDLTEEVAALSRPEGE